MQEMQETWVQSLGREEPLEEEMATHCQYPCLENPMDRGVWQATVYGVAKSRTQLRDLAQVQDAVSDQMSITLPGRY